MKGSLPDTSSSGLVPIDVKTQDAFGGSTTSNNGTTNPPDNTTAAVPEFPLSSLMIMAIVVGLGVLFVRASPGLSNKL